MQESISVQEEKFYNSDKPLELVEHQGVFSSSCFFLLLIGTTANVQQESPKEFPH
ncbi:hypothetical protein EG68_03551 [Paragonimus skrjabini miyazakii]|uniref:Uncharacterized protein n=1 Tax=Paragonimus skrjabini miyazakii TaxID=59628 RepID=A0A8S9Z1L7_9TREM|nr:hypothetical protein EG68_03551 [Paragonimus skrjabini miyazakii]